MLRATENWLEEKRSAYLYSVMAKHELDSTRQQLFAQLGQEAEKQAQLWALQIGNLFQKLPTEYKPERRVRIIAWLIQHFGTKNIKPILAANKIRGLSVYNHGHDSRHIIGYHPLPNSIEEVGASHRILGQSSGGSGDELRAAVFGVNDGLVSIACLVLGVAGAGTAHQTILLTGIAGLLAGAFSMAAGEYISMRSQREMFEYQIGLERAELAQYPEQEASELALIYRARGMTEIDAKNLADKMIANPALGLDALAREELGLNPDQLGSPRQAAIASFIAFSAGGLIPLLPYLFHLPYLFDAQIWTLRLSILLTLFALFGVGAVLSLFTGRKAWLSGLRMLMIGSSAGVITYAIGYWMSVSIA